MGRKRRVSTYLQAPLKRAKNIHTRRTQAATIHRDITKLASQKTNKRLKKG
jgi:hypothetical protein